MATYTSQPIQFSIAEGASEFQRADLVFYEVDHSGPSFEGRVFLNHSEATAETPAEEVQGYVGSFHVFGHGGCFGDVGHCDVPRQLVSPFDRRGPHQLTPQTKRVIVTDYLRAHPSKNNELTVTIVPVVRDSPFASAADEASVLKLDRVALMTYE